MSGTYQGQQPRILLDDLSFPEGPRWYDATLWFVNGGTVCRVDLDGPQRDITPRSTGIWAPVTKRASSLASHATAAAMSDV